MAKKKRSKRRELYREYLKSNHWRDLRMSKLSLVPRCENCGHDNYLHVHHVNYRDLLSCTVEDLVVLCDGCHDDLHTAISMLRKKSHHFPLEQLKELISKYRRGEVGVVKRNVSEKRLIRQQEKIQKKLNTLKGLARDGIFKKPLSIIINKFWASNRTVDKLIILRDDINQLIEENQRQ